MKSQVIQGNCLDRLKELPENSVDSIVTDPPYELGFMGKSWDSTGIANNKEMWAECLRVLKPGGHLLAFSGTRTYHRMASAIEDAGFEVRDMIEWVYGSGFPKSLNIGKAVDKLQGNEREILKVRTDGAGNGNSENVMYDAYHKFVATKVFNETKGTSEWEGWGTALKPAHEPICMARKPLSEKTVAENCLKYRTGGINIDGSRVVMSPEDKEMLDAKSSTNNNGVNFDVGEGKAKGTATPANNLGRFPANLIHDNSEEVRECFPEVKGKKPFKKLSGFNFDVAGQNKGQKYESQAGLGETGNASRFFKSIIYQAKSSKSERTSGGTITNQHPTIKPIALMEYLIKMVTPKGGIVLDPFAGSGSTLVAAKQNGYEYIGIELTPEYIPIINARLK